MSTPWHTWLHFVDCGLVQVDPMKNKLLCLNSLDAWWTMDWFRSTPWRKNVYTLTNLTLGGLVQVDSMKNKLICLNSLDAWWTMDWFKSTPWRKNVYTLTNLMLGGLWTGSGRPYEEQTSTPSRAWHLDGLWTCMEEHTSWTLLYIDYSTCTTQLDGSGHVRSTCSARSVRSHELYLLSLAWSFRLRELHYQHH